MKGEPAGLTAGEPFDEKTSADDLESRGQATQLFAVQLEKNAFLSPGNRFDASSPDEGNLGM